MRPMTSRRLIAAVVAALSAFAGMAAAAPSPSPGAGSGAAPGGVSVVPVPSSPHMSGKGQRLDFGQLRPGQTARDEVLVRNIGDAAASVYLYAADATTALGGGLAFGLRTDPRTTVGRWMTLSRSQLSVPPHGTVTVALTVTLPTSLQGGEYAGGVVAEQLSPPPSGGGVAQVYRFAMPVYLTVPGGVPGSTPGRGQPDGSVQVVDVDFGERDGKVCPRVTYRNSSQAIVNPDASVEVHPRWIGGGGTRHYGAIGSVLPDSQATVALPCRDLPFGGGKVVVRLAGPHVDPDHAQRRADLDRSGFPLLIALLLLLLLVALLWWWLVRERRRRHADQAS